MPERRDNVESVDKKAVPEMEALEQLGKKLDRILVAQQWLLIMYFLTTILRPILDLFR